MKRMDGIRYQRCLAKKKRIRRNRKILALVLILISLWITTSVLAKGSESDKPVSITVRAGETLWDIAASCRKPGQDVRLVIDSIKKLNQKETSIIYAGEVLLIPGK